MLTVDFDRLPGSGMLLDIGCGAGRHSFEALRRGYRVVSVDLNADVLKEVAAMAAAMTEVGEAPRSASSHCVNASALELPFEEASFDVVIASEVLEHIIQDEVALGEIARVTKPGGDIVTTVPRRWPERVCWALSDEYHSEAGGHVRIYTKPELVEKLRRQGLAVNASHHAHALHVPYWWLKCAFGVDNKEASAPKAYHRFLVRDIEKPIPAMRSVEKALNPVMGKSVVLYAEKPRA
ncbi:MAG: class I SAM-dependent methyltransferase [Actinomycetota bacterium]|nr:class I SAM-dependent methyltransferase [Actinomycetota bacterium]